MSTLPGKRLRTGSISGRLRYSNINKMYKYDTLELIYCLHLYIIRTASDLEESGLIDKCTELYYRSFVIFFSFLF